MTTAWKFVVVGLGCWCAVATPHAQFCEQWHRPTYCNPTWDLPHGPHSDQRPINTVRSLETVAPSTSSGAGMVNPDFFFKPPGSA